MTKPNNNLDQFRTDLLDEIQLEGIHEIFRDLDKAKKESIDQQFIVKFKVDHRTLGIYNPKDTKNFALKMLIPTWQDHFKILHIADLIPCQNDNENLYFAIGSPTQQIFNFYFSKPKSSKPTHTLTLLINSPVNMYMAIIKPI
jgi:hypothetical protein